MRMHRLITWLLLCLLSAAVNAGRTPSNYPESFPHAGTVDGIDLQERTLIISDTIQSLAAVVQVHDGSGSLGSLLQLRQGMEIGYRTMAAGRQRGPIAEIWILPNGYLEANRARQRY
jgi:hypothetical protein